VGGVGLMRGGDVCARQGGLPLLASRYVRICLKELVELEDRPDPAPTASRKNENRNWVLSKPDNENFQSNQPGLIISYMLEHYRVKSL